MVEGRVGRTPVASGSFSFSFSFSSSSSIPFLSAENNNIEDEDDDDSNPLTVQPSATMESPGPYSAFPPGSHSALAPIVRTTACYRVITTRRADAVLQHLAHSTSSKSSMKYRFRSLFEGLVSSLPWATWARRRRRSRGQERIHMVRMCAPSYRGPRPRARTAKIGRAHV